MPKKVKFPQKETEIAEIELGFDETLVDDEHDGVFMHITKKDGTEHTRLHKQLCPWD